MTIVFELGLIRGYISFFFFLNLATLPPPPPSQVVAAAAGEKTKESARVGRRQAAKEKFLFGLSYELENRNRAAAPEEVLEVRAASKRLDGDPDAEVLPGEGRAHLRVFGSREDAARLLTEEGAVQ